MNPTNPNEAEDAERELLIPEVRELINSAGGLINLKLATILADFILADRQTQRQKWIKGVEARAPGLNEIISKEYNDGFADASMAWREALRGDK